MSTMTAVRKQPEADWHAEWVSALATLELDVAGAERLLGEGRAAAGAVDAPVQIAVGWTPPRIGGPLPVSLRGRAEAILARQLRVSEDLGRAIGSNRRERALARRMDFGAADRSRPAFVDSEF